MFRNKANTSFTFPSLFKIEELMAVDKKLIFTDIFILVKLLRAHQWIKNLFIFTPIFFGGGFLDLTNLTLVLYGFIAFSLAASSIYIINDILDVEYDRLHPVKSKRPIASGQVPVYFAVSITAVLFISAAIIAFTINFNFGLLLISYLLLNLLYTKKLKHIPIIDITCISIGFVLRVLSGGVIAGIEVSKWLVIMTFLLSLFLALGKRRDDIILEKGLGNTMRKAIKGYNLDFINSSMMIMAAVLIVGYLMYVISPEITARITNPYFYFSVFFVIIGVLRFLQLAFVQEQTGSPTKIAYSDTFIQLVLVGWVIYFFCMLYL